MSARLRKRRTTVTFRINELAKAAGVGRTLLYEELKAGRLKAHKIGSRTVILIEDANAWIRSRPVTLSST